MAKTELYNGILSRGYCEDASVRHFSTLFFSVPQSLWIFDHNISYGLPNLIALRPDEEIDGFFC